MVTKLDTRSNALVESAASRIMRSMDNSVDVRTAVVMIVEEVWDAALKAGVAAGVESMATGRFERAVKDIERAVRAG